MKEYKAVKVKWDVNLEQVNKLMNDMAKDGWEVVNVTTEPPNTLNFVVVLCREV
ncbi:MAG: DUF4177 domain-containing protein [Oscillospiraceae bacterium]|nr:DUF4177 domain-containing protein [Oscillospiraceae bacterium]